MKTSENVLWSILQKKLKRDVWVDISELYSIVVGNYTEFTFDDWQPVTPTNKEPTWHRNLRNALQKKKATGEILYGGNANYQLPTSTSAAYFLVGSKYGEYRNIDMLPLMEKHNVISTGFAWNFDLKSLYREPEASISNFLKKKKEEPKSYNTLKKFLQLKPGDFVAIKSNGNPKAGKPFLEIVAYAVVVERDGIVYWHEPEEFGHCINVQFIKTGLKRQFNIGGYGRTIHSITGENLIQTFFDDYKIAGSTRIRNKIKSRRRTRKASENLNLLGQPRKGNEGYVTNPIHNRIQEQFKLHLEEEFGKDNVELEGNNVDIKLFQPDSITFYEVKPYDFAEDCIRSGLGQLLSYAFFDEDWREKKIRIVGPFPPDKEEIKFIEFLKKNLIVDFEYVCFKII